MSSGTFAETTGRETPSFHWGLDTKIGAAGVHAATGERASLRMKLTEKNRRRGRKEESF